MTHLNISLDDWQRAALAELADARGMDLETMARSLLSERLVERMHTSFDDLLMGDALLIGDIPSADTIEQRLRKLFGE